MATVDVFGQGHVEAETVSASTKTLSAANCGILQNVTATSTITLPATAAKFNFLLRVGKEGITLTISPNASDKIAGTGASNSGVGADDKDLIFTNQPAGSFVQLQGDGVDGYTITAIRGTATFQS